MGIRVMVCLPPEAAEDVPAALAQALAPFELMCGFGERGIWDWWAIRGGSEGRGFSSRPGFQDDPRLIHDTPRNDTEPLPSLPGMCAGGPRGLLDLSEYQELSERLARLRARAEDPWELWQRLAPDHPPVLPLSQFRGPRGGAGPSRSVLAIWADFTAQPLWQAFTADQLSQLPELATPLPLWRHPRAASPRRSPAAVRSSYAR
ncbi:hypothetical protein GXW82_15265 [Streptacidiphilus sp. 4-A2]|nr:hypothetical protein [Streptacidiphilus sp. 4-A2]